MPSEQVWELLCSERAQRRWMGPKGRLHTGPRGTGTIGLSDGSSANLQTIASTRNETLDVIARSDAGTMNCRLSLQPSRSATILRLDTGPVEGDGQAIRSAFEQALGRLRALVNDINRRRSSPRQAVVVIHGIGNQEPGSTLMRFMDGVFEGRSAFSKPDNRSHSFELRRIHLPSTATSPTTDVYEMYWAHLMTGTTVAQVTAWAWPLLQRRIPARFARARLMLIALCAATIAATAAAIKWGYLPARLGAVVGVVSGVVGFIWRWKVQGAVVTSIGDAARYLTATPTNIANRQTIREAGVSLLRELHDSGDYDRIVIVGHSLGSVIAYDMLSFYWVEIGSELDPVGTQRDRALRKAEKSIARPFGDPQATQRALWSEQRSNGQRWLVTDLVTLGSPLSMADFLLADGADDLLIKQERREYPTCPPQTEEVSVGSRRHQRISYDRHVTGSDGVSRRKSSTLHHAAVFGLTRWTNLFFPVKLLAGDPIGGPVAPHFGNWIRDVPLARPSAPKRRLHGWYWRKTTPRTGNVASLDIVREALHLDCAAEIRNSMKSWSPLLYLPKDVDDDR